MFVLEIICSWNLPFRKPWPSNLFSETFQMRFGIFWKFRQLKSRPTEDYRSEHEDQLVVFRIRNWRKRDMMEGTERTRMKSGWFFQAYRWCSEIWKPLVADIFESLWKIGCHNTWITKLYLRLAYLITWLSISCGQSPAVLQNNICRSYFAMIGEYVKTKLFKFKHIYNI